MNENSELTKTCYYKNISQACGDFFTILLNCYIVAVKQFNNRAI